MINPSKGYSIKEAMNLTTLSRTTIYRERRDGNLLCLYKRGRCLILGSEIIRYLKEE